MNTLKSMPAALFAFLSFIGFCLLAILISADIPAPYHIVTGAVILIIGLYVTYSVFSIMNRRGTLEIMTGDNASYELDNLEPAPDDGVAKLSAADLVEKFNKNEFKLPTVNISIWGDKNGRHLNEDHAIKSIIFNEEKNILTITFSNNFILKVKTPGAAFVTTSYLKIIKAAEIMWQIQGAASGRQQFNYLNNGKNILTKSNTAWKPQKYDLGVGMNALYLQG